MRRREFIAVLGGAVGAASALPIAARAQPIAMPVIGFMSGRWPEELAGAVAAFHQGLAETGYVDGRNVMVEYRWAEGRYDRLPAMAAELLERRVTVLAAVGGAVSGLAAKAATTTTPIVFSSGGDQWPWPRGELQPAGRQRHRRQPRLRRARREAARTAARVDPESSLDRGSREPCLSQRRGGGGGRAGRARALGLKLLVLEATVESEIAPAFEILAAGAYRSACSSQTIPSSPGLAARSSRSQSATRCRRSTTSATSCEPAV